MKQSLVMCGSPFHRLHDPLAREFYDLRPAPSDGRWKPRRQFFCALNIIATILRHCVNFIQIIKIALNGSIMVKSFIICVRSANVIDSSTMVLSFVESRLILLCAVYSKWDLCRLHATFLMSRDKVYFNAKSGKCVLFPTRELGTNISIFKSAFMSTAVTWNLINAGFPSWLVEAKLEHSSNTVSMIAGFNSDLFTIYIYKIGGLFFSHLWTL